MMKSKTREIYKDNFADYLLCLALDVGEGMLKNGGEVGRVEDTIERICRAYGAQHVEVFTIVSMITAAVRMPDGSYSSQLRRVKQTGNDLGMLESLNALSREICRTTPELDLVDQRIREMKRSRQYPVWLSLLASAAGAAAFCLFFGGDFLDALVTFGIGALIYCITNFSSKRVSAMARTVVSSFVASLISALLSLAIPTLGVDYIIIGAIMLLVPGLMFGTAMRDLFCGDLLAGTLKILQTFLQTVMIGFGYMLSYSIVGDALISAVESESVYLVAIRFVTAAITSVAFALVFRTNKRHLWAVLFAGIITFAVYFWVCTLTNDSLFWAAFLSSAVAAIFSEVNARVRKAPSLVVLMPAVISIVPGGYLYRAVRDFVKGEPSGGLSNLGSAGAISMGLAGGIVAATIVFGITHDVLKKIKKTKKASAVNENKENKEYCLK